MSKKEVGSSKSTYWVCWAKTMANHARWRWPPDSCATGNWANAVIALRPEACLAAIEECAAIGVRGVVIPTEGFSDSDEGRRLQRDLVARVRRHGMRLLGPGS